MANQEKFKTMIGGQALVEGIMMRGPQKDAIVVRTEDGIKVETNSRKVRKEWIKNNPNGWACSEREILAVLEQLK